MKKLLYTTALAFISLTAIASENEKEAGFMSEIRPVIEKVQIKNAYYWTSQFKQVKIRGRFATIRSYTAKNGKVVKIDVYTETGEKLPIDFKNVRFWVD